MDNLVESNERTLVMFDSVCSGLAACLSLVHADIKQMTEHRNRLAQLEHDQIQAKLIPPQELATASPEITNPDSRQLAQRQYQQQQQQQKSRRHPTPNGACDDANVGCDDDDPHHLMGLKMLDKRLADSFSQALSLNDLQKSSITAKQQASQNKPTIFQVLLGKSNKSNNNNISNNTSRKRKNSKIALEGGDGERAVDNTMLIDDINRQTRLAMQYAKQLEANLFKVEDLRSRYEMHLKMGLVVKSVSKAYLANNNHSSPNTLSRRQHSSSLVINDSMSISSLNLSTWSSSRSRSNLNASSSSLKKSSRNSQGQASKTTIREFIENIDRIEAEFETYMGSFLLAIEDIQGFARVCQGDVFEISIKYGVSQKFKTKISVLKDNRQRCDNKQAVFKARISDVLAIKAYECKGLGKRVLLGHKLCETRDLFTARSQLMTISLNQTGSIKLNLIVTWNPLHLAPNSSTALQGVDISHVSLPPTPISSSTLSSLSSVPSLSGATTTINIRSQQRPGNKIRQHSPVTAQHPDAHDTPPYQTVDPTYGYYVPPPDYITNSQ